MRLIIRAEAKLRRIILPGNYFTRDSKVSQMANFSILTWTLTSNALRTTSALFVEHLQLHANLPPPFRNPAPETIHGDGALRSTAKLRNRARPGSTCPGGWYVPPEGWTYLLQFGRTPSSSCPADNFFKTDPSVPPPPATSGDRPLRSPYFVWVASKP